MALSAAEVEVACCEPPEETEGFYMQQTMIRVKDPRASIKFYTQVLGMRLLKRLDCPDMKFSLYFLGYTDDADIPKDEAEKTEFCFTRRATLELTHYWGTEEQEGNVYHSGNEEPRGFGHIGILVDDVYAVCKRLENMGIPFIKRPDQGTVQHVSFIADPDGYWIDLLSHETIRRNVESRLLTVLG